MEDVHSASYVGRGAGLHCLSGYPSLVAPPHVHHLEDLMSFLFFNGGFII